MKRLVKSALWIVVAGATTLCAESGHTTEPSSVGALAYLEPEGDVVHISTPSSAKGATISRILVHEGEIVSAGQPIAILDNANVLEAEVRNAEASVDRAKAELWMARRKQERVTILEARPGLVSITDSDMAQNKLAEAQAELKAAEATYFRQKLLAGEAIVRALQSGTVLTINAHAGEAEKAASGLVDLADTSRMYAVAEVYETDVRFVKPGQRANFRSNALPETVGGKVERIQGIVRPAGLSAVSPARDRDARVVRVYILLDSPDKVDHFIHMQGEVVIQTNSETASAKLLERTAAAGR